MRATTDPAAPTPEAQHFLSNALASLLRTASGGFLLLVVPIVLVRSVGPDRYASWAIAVEVATYLGLLELGGFTAVSHFAAEVRPDDTRGRGRVVSTMLALQAALALVGGAVLAVLVVLVPSIWSRTPSGQVPEARQALVALGVAALLGVPVNALVGYFLSLRRVIVPSSITFVSRLLGAAAVMVVAATSGSLVAAAWVWVAASVAGYGLILLSFRRTAVPVGRSLLSWPLGRRMLDFSVNYGVWVLAGFLVVGIDTVIVARIEFGAVAAYATSAGAASVVAAIYSSALTPLVPATADLAAAGRTKALAGLVVTTTRRGSVGVAGLAATASLLADPLLTVWVGEETAAKGVPLFQILLAATAVRLLTFPYAVALFGVAEHRRARNTPLVEGVVNVVASVGLGLALGPIGVALGTVLGALAGAALHLAVNLPRTEAFSLPPRDLVRDGIAPAVVVGAPAVAILAMAAGSGTPMWAAALGVALVAVLAWTVGLTPPDRARLVGALRSRGGRVDRGTR